MSEYPQSLGGQHGFEVGVSDCDGWGPDPVYIVRLPHQCGEWTVTAEADKAKAIAEVETFIAEAQAALEKLREA